MGGGKQSPRQKMIGMMYLVLTAMLALNVSKDAVEAFKKVDHGLTRIIANYTKKNDLIYQEFERAAAENPARAGALRDSAFEVRQRANEVFDFIQDLKIEIINATEGEGNLAVNGREVIIDNVKKIAENNTPSQILIGANADGRAFAMRQLLNEYREFLIGKVDGRNPIVEEAITDIINTSDHRRFDGEMIPWPQHTFQTLPLVAVICILSEYQVNVRNAETEVINFLFDQIDAAAFRFNRLMPIVIATSDHVTVGSDYEARVFISAVDTTQHPIITVDGNQLPIDEAGRGIYRIRATSVGTRRWGGVITLRAPDGSDRNFPFESQFTVSEPSLIVSPTAMNVMYAGIPNPIDVSVPGVTQDRITVRVENGRLSTERVRNPSGQAFPGAWTVIPEAAGRNVRVFVTADAPGGRMQFPPYEFRVKNVPDPVATFAQRTSGTVPRATAAAQAGVFAIMPDFDFELTYQVTGFSILFSDRGSDYEERSNSHLLTAAQRDLIGRLVRGNNLIIKDIRAQGPDGRSIDLSPIILRID